jgi:rhamnosyltransferase subunit B
MHFVAIGAGSMGDVLPALLTARVLKARGHDVQFITAPDYQDVVADAGIDFVAGGSRAQFDAVIADPDVWHPRRAMETLWRHIGPLWSQAYDVLAKVVRPGESVVFGGGLALQMRLVQEKLGVKAVTMHLAPAGLLSAYDPPLLPSLAWLGRLPPVAVAGILSIIERRVVDPMILPDLNRFRASVGLPAVKAKVASRWMNSPDAVLCAFPAWFAPPQPDWPPNAICTTFAMWTSPEGVDLPGPLAAFLDAGPPPLLFTPGSGMAHGREFFTRAVETSLALGMRAVLVTPYVAQLPERLPATVIHSHYVPFDLLVPRTALLVHHGGIGTVAQGLAAAKPQMITPFAYDQPDNGRRLKILGVAETVSPRASAKRWIQAIDRLLGDPGVEQRCKELAARLQQEGSGAERNAELLLTVASGQAREFAPGKRIG